RRQGKRRGLGELQRLWHRSDNALVYQLQLTVAARADQRPGVPHLVTGLEQRYVGTDRLDHAGSVPTEDARLCFVCMRHVALADFGIDRVDRYGLDFYQQVARPRHWLG